MMIMMLMMMMTMMMMTMSRRWLDEEELHKNQLQEKKTGKGVQLFFIYFSLVLRINKWVFSQKVV